MLRKLTRHASLHSLSFSGPFRHTLEAARGETTKSLVGTNSSRALDNIISVMAVRQQGAVCHSRATAASSREHAKYTRQAWRIDCENKSFSLCTVMRRDKRTEANRLRSRCTLGCRARVRVRHYTAFGISAEEMDEAAKPKGAQRARLYTARTAT